MANGIVAELAELIGLSAAARGLAFARPRQARSPRIGLFGSRFRGRGVDYRESREYQGGDDIRHMDWRLTARSGRAHTKLFEEERERPILVLLDLNPSMFFGTRVRFKSVQAARCAALIAWIVTQGGDRVGLIGFGGGCENELKPAGGRRGVLAALSMLHEWQGRAAATPLQVGMAAALKRAQRIARPGSLIVIVSDFLSYDDDAAAQLSQLAAHCDLAALCITDPLEMAAPAPGRYPVREAAGERVLDFRDSATRNAWAGYFSACRNRAIDALRRRGIAHWLVATQDDTQAALQRGLVSGKGRVAGAA